MRYKPEKYQLTIPKFRREKLGPIVRKSMDSRTRGYTMQYDAPWTPSIRASGSHKHIADQARRTVDRYNILSPKGIFGTTYNDRI